MKYTDTYNMKMPDQTDNYNVDDMNYNTALIDQTLNTQQLKILGINEFIQNVTMRYNSVTDYIQLGIVTGTDSKGIPIISWTDWRRAGLKKLYFYLNGVDYADITGGWTANSGTVTINDGTGNMSWGTSSTSDKILTTISSPINIGGLTTMEVDYSSTGSAGSVYIELLNTSNTVIATSGNIRGKSGTFKFEGIDPNYTGVVFRVRANGSSSGYSVKIKMSRIVFY